MSDDDAIVVPPEPVANPGKDSSGLLCCDSCDRSTRNRDDYINCGSARYPKMRCKRCDCGQKSLLADGEEHVKKKCRHEVKGVQVFPNSRSRARRRIGGSSHEDGSGRLIAGLFSWSQFQAAAACYDYDGNRSFQRMRRHTRRFAAFA